MKKKQPTLTDIERAIQAPHINRRPKKQPLFRIIRDPRDARRDYWVTAEQLQVLLDKGKLEQINVYSNRWDYAEKEGK